MGLTAPAVRSSSVPEESKSWVGVQLLQQRQGTDRGGRSEVGSPDVMGLPSAEQLCQPVGEVEGTSPVRRFLEPEKA